MMYGVRTRIEVRLLQSSFCVVRKSAPSTGMSPRSGILSSRARDAVAHEAADDDGLLIPRRRAASVAVRFDERNDAERARRRRPASLISSVSSRRTSFDSFRWGMILIFVPTSWRGAAKPPTDAEAAERAERARRAAAPPPPRPPSASRRRSSGAGCSRRR